METRSFQTYPAGNVYVTKSLRVILECKECYEQFGVYSKFLDHVFGKHFEDWTTSKASNVDHNAEAKTKETDDLPEKYSAGEVYVTTNFCIVFRCEECYEECSAYSKFLDHIFGKHFKGSTEKANSNETTSNGKNPDEISTNYNQYLESESNEIIEYSSGNSFKIEILNSMKSDGAVNKSNVEESVKESSVKALYKNTRPVKRFLTTPKNHGKERKHKCRICGFAVADLSNLLGHEKRHSTIRPYTCLYCDKAFYTSTELTIHTRRHTGEKPYVCTYCGRGFISTAILNKHERHHTGDRRYKCDQCDKSFYDNHQLKNHILCHTKERNFTCEVCKQKFSRKMTLRTHMKLHENALRYECIICHMRFNQRPTLLWHIKRKHNVMMEKKEDLEATSQLDDNECNSEQNMFIINA